MKKSLIGVIGDTCGGGSSLGSFHGDGEHSPDVVVAGFRQGAQQILTDGLGIFARHLQFLHLPVHHSHLPAGLLSLLVVGDFVEVSCL